MKNGCTKINFQNTFSGSPLFAFVVPKVLLPNRMLPGLVLIRGGFA